MTDTKQTQGVVITFGENSIAAPLLTTFELADSIGCRPTNRNEILHQILDDNDPDGYTETGEPHEYPVMEILSPG